MTTHILITGASRGIGAAIADALTSDTTNVVALSGADGDLADPTIPETLWRTSLDRLGGRIDVLVNNAGVFEANPIDASDADWLAGWNRTMQVNLTASAQLCRSAVGTGRIGARAAVSSTSRAARPIGATARRTGITRPRRPAWSR